MKKRRINGSLSRKVFQVFNIGILSVLTLVCLLPFVYVISVSLSDNNMIAAGMVTFWPKGFTTVAYEFLLTRPSFWKAFENSVFRLVLGTGMNLMLILLTAYPLSKSDEKFRGRTIYAWYFFVTMIVNGGLIPSYMLISKLGLRDTIWALVLPGALPVFNLVLMINFFRTVPEELEDAALIDGAGHLRTLIQIYIPVSKPAIATISLFCMVNHWNAWFDGMIYINSPEKIPLQTYLRSVLMKMDMSEMTGDGWEMLALLSDQALRCAQIVVAVIPILCVYPFLQRYFVTGITLGSVKG